jgi:RimJ/RimL family protein N-acetyltransferase
MDRPSIGGGRLDTKRIFLETERLLIGEFDDDHAESLWALDRDPEVMRYIGPHQLADVAAYRNLIRTWRERYYAQLPGFGFWPAHDKESLAFVGWFHLRPATLYRFADAVEYADGDHDLGYRLHRVLWGQGLATEGSRAIVRHAFDTMRTPRVVAVALKENVASIRVMEKLGMRRVGEYHLPGYDMPAVKYHLP